MKGGSLHTHRALPRQCAIRRLAMWLHQVAASKEDFRDASPRSSACATASSPESLVGARPTKAQGRWDLGGSQSHQNRHGLACVASALGFRCPHDMCISEFQPCTCLAHLAQAAGKEQ